MTHKLIIFYTCIMNTMSLSDGLTPLYISSGIVIPMEAGIYLIKLDSPSYRVCPRGGRDTGQAYQARND